MQEEERLKGGLVRSFVHRENESTARGKRSHVALAAVRLVLAYLRRQVVWGADSGVGKLLGA